MKYKVISVILILLLASFLISLYYCYCRGIPMWIIEANLKKNVDDFDYFVNTMKNNDEGVNYVEVWNDSGGWNVLYTYGDSEGKREITDLDSFCDNIIPCDKNRIRTFLKKTNINYSTGTIIYSAKDDIVFYDMCHFISGEKGAGIRGILYSDKEVNKSDAPYDEIYYHLIHLQGNYYLYDRILEIKGIND